jgi:hypothetical protein
MNTSDVRQAAGRAPHTWDRCRDDRQHGTPALGIRKVRGFPRVCVDRAACRGFWLDKSWEGRFGQARDRCRYRRNLCRRRASRPTGSGTRLGCRGWRRGWISCAAVRLWFGRGRRPARHLVPDGTDIEDRPLTVHQAGESIPAAIRSVLDRRASNQGGRAQPRARGRGFKRMVEAADPAG